MNLVSPNIPHGTEQPQKTNHAELMQISRHSPSYEWQIYRLF